MFKMIKILKIPCTYVNYSKNESACDEALIQRTKYFTKIIAETSNLFARSHT